MSIERRVVLAVVLLVLAALTAFGQEPRVAEVVYGPQAFTAGTFAKPTSFKTTAHGGADAPISGYPEFAAGEEIKTVNGGGTLGERVVDANVAGTYSSGGLAMLGMGDLPSGEWDGTDGIVVEWDQYFSSAALADSFVGQVMVLVARLSVIGASPDPEVGLFSGDSFVWIGFEQDAGANFHYDIFYVVNGSSVHDTSVVDVADNAWHRVKIRYKPGTVTGALSGLYFPRAADGYFELLVDGVSLLSAANIKFDIPTKSVYSTTPNLAYGAWHGYAGLLGKFTNFTISRETTTIAPIPVAPSRAPIALCDPQTQVGNGGKGQAGCNTGGVGWTSGYDGPYGEAPSYANPAAGETLTGKRGVDYWIELVHTDYPSGVQTTYRRGLVELGDLSTYHGGRKPAGLLSVGEIEHGLSNEQGGYEAATVDIVYSDAIDRLFRNLLLTQDVEGDELRVCAATPAARALGTAPRILARGIVQQSATESVLEAKLTAVDALFSDFGPFGPDRQWPSLLIPDGVWQNTPPDSLKLPIPHLYGEKSDDGATNPADGVTENPKGLIPLKYVGQEDLAADSPEAAPWVVDATIPQLPNPLTTTNYAHNGGDIKVTTYVWGAAVRDGQICGVPEAVGPMNPLGVTEEDGVALAVHFNRITDGADYYIFWVSDDGAFHPVTNPTAGNVGTATHDDATYDGAFGFDFTAVIKTLHADGGSVWDAYIVHLGAGFRILSLYGSDLGGGIPENTHDRVRLDPERRSDVLGPDWIWPFAKRYRSYTLADGTVLDLTMLYLRGPISDDHKNGVCTLAVNAIGREATGDGTGLPLIDAHVVQQSWIENDLLNSYTSGLAVTSLTKPTWEDGTPKVRSSSFAAAQALGITKFGGRGLTVGWYVDKPRSLREWFREWNESTETRLGTEGHGQIMLGYLDDAEDRSVWPRVDHAPDIFGPVTRIPGHERENVVVGECDWDPDAEKFRVAPITLKSAQAIRQYKNREKSRDQPVSSTILNDGEQMRLVLAHRLQRLKTGETMVEITVPLGFIDYDVNTGILLNTIEGVGETGDVNKPYKIMRRKVNLRPPALVTYSLLDVERRLVDVAATSEGVAIADTVQAGGLMPTEVLAIGDEVLVEFSDLLSAPSESVRIVDTVTRTIPVNASAAEAAKITETVVASGLWPTETVRVGDGISAAGLMPMERLRLSDEVIAARGLTASVSEALKVVDAVAAALE